MWGRVASTDLSRHRAEEDDGMRRDQNVRTNDQNSILLHARLLNKPLSMACEHLISYRHEIASVRIGVIAYAPLTPPRHFFNPGSNLMFRRDLIAREFLDCLLSPVDKTPNQHQSHIPHPTSHIPHPTSHPIPNEEKARRGKTHISPSATIQIVCQTPNPILGVTPR